MQDLCVVVVLPEHSHDADYIGAQIADAIDCWIVTAHGIRAALSAITRECPHIAIVDEQLAFVEGQPIRAIVAAISPGTQVVLIKTDAKSHAGAHRTAAPE